MEVSAGGKLPCAVQEDGALVFSARMLTEMLQRLPLDTVQISRPDNHGRMASEAKKMPVMKWMCGIAVPFPSRTFLFPEDTVKLSGIPAGRPAHGVCNSAGQQQAAAQVRQSEVHQCGTRAAGSNGNCIVTAKGDDQSKGRHQPSDPGDLSWEAGPYVR